MTQTLERDYLVAELEELIDTGALGIAKQLHRSTGALDGTFPCPRCRLGTIGWAVAANGVTAVLCTTTYTDVDGKPVRCTSLVD